MKSEIVQLTGNINDMKSEMAATKSEMATTKSNMAHLTGKIDNIRSEMATKSEMTQLNNNLTTQMKSFTETVSAQINVLTANMESKISVLNANMNTNNANMESRLDKFENRFLFRMLFAVSGLLRICYILPPNNYKGI
jgi:chromosome segregation ATPase